MRVMSGVGIRLVTRPLMSATVSAEMSKWTEVLVTLLGVGVLLALLSGFVTWAAR